MIKIIDKEKKCLRCYSEDSINASYWHLRWNNNNLRELFNSVRKRKKLLFETKITEKYLSKNAKVLEGGCGMAMLTYELHLRGFDAYGLDYDEKIVDIIKEVQPQLNIIKGDLNSLDFEDNFFDGFWSPGVIEHDVTGYEKMAMEINRVLKPNGYLFLSHPQMNPYRRFRMKLNSYSKKDVSALHFYQYIYDPKDTIKNFEQYGFELVKRYSRNGVKGVIDEMKLFDRLLSPFIYYRGKNPVMKAIKGSLFISFNMMFSKFCGYATLLVLRKKQT